MDHTLQPAAGGANKGGCFQSCLLVVVPVHGGQQQFHVIVFTNADNGAPETAPGLPRRNAVPQSVFGNRHEGIGGRYRDLKKPGQGLMTLGQ